MFIPNKIIFFSLFLLLPAVAESTYAEEMATLERNLQTLHLGMTPQAFQEAVPSDEMKKMYLSLLPGEQFFTVKEEALMEGIVELTGRFFNKKLFKITVGYAQDWYDESSWDALISEYLEKYWEVPLEERMMREGKIQIARWEDSSTVYILRRQVKLRFKESKLINKSTVVRTILDKVLWDKRVKAENDRMF